MNFLAGVIDAYVEAADAPNHAVREAGCAEGLCVYSLLHRERVSFTSVVLLFIFLFMFLLLF